jgi:hypothetical protein
MKDPIRVPVLAVATLWCTLLAPKGAQSRNAEWCDQQAECIRFHAVLVPPIKCGIRDCPVKVCLIFDLAAAGCPIKGQTPLDFDYACDNASKDLCPRDGEWNPNSNTADRGAGACTNQEGSDQVCEPLAQGDKMCQVGKPGQTLYFTL